MDSTRQNVNYHRAVGGHKYGSSAGTGRNKLHELGCVSRLWSCVKRRLTFLTFVLLIASVLLGVMNTQWRANKERTRKISSKIYQPIGRFQEPLRPAQLVETNAAEPSSIVRTRDMESNLYGDNDWELTSYKYSTYKIITPNKDIKAGQDIIIRVQSRNEKDEEITFGGDFWQACIFWNSVPRASSAGKVTDYQNGTYTVRFHVARTGLGLIHIILVHPKKVVDFLRLQIWNIEQRIYWYGKYTDVGGQDHWSKCFMTTEMASEDEDGYCYYGNPDALGETLFVCEKKDSVSCDMLTHTLVNEELTKVRIWKLVGSKLYLFDRLHYWRRLEAGPKMFFVRNEVKQSDLEAKLPVCNPDLPRPTSSEGFWLAERWHSLQCDVTQWRNPDEISHCLQGHHLYILGDSTLRQWLTSLYNMLGVPFLIQTHEKLYMDRYIEPADINVTFRFHPQVVSGYEVDVNDVEYEVDVLDRLAPELSLNDYKCNYIVVLGPWSHFTQWTRQSYIERLLLLKAAVERFRERCPYSPIIVKGPHPREHATVESVVYSSDYFLYQEGILMESIFADSGAWFMNVWEMNLAYPEKNNIHMPFEVVEQELNMFLSYVCPALAKRNNR